MQRPIALFYEHKDYPSIGQDNITATFEAVQVHSDRNYDSNMSAVIYRGTLKAGHYTYTERYEWNPDINTDDMLEVVPVSGKNPSEIMRDTIARCDKWFAECQKRISAALQPA